MNNFYLYFNYLLNCVNQINYWVVYSILLGMYCNIIEFNCIYIYIMMENIIINIVLLIAFYYTWMGTCNNYISDVW